MRWLLVSVWVAVGLALLMVATGADTVELMLMAAVLLALWTAVRLARGLK